MKITVETEFDETKDNLAATITYFKYEAKQVIVRALLEKYDWNVSEIARILHADRSNFLRELRELGIVRPDEKKPKWEIDKNLRDGEKNGNT